MTVYTRQIPELTAPSLGRLGRHVRHDPVNRQYAVGRSAAAPVTTRRARHIGSLDQANLSSCVGNAWTGVLATDGVFKTLPSGLVLAEPFAVALYSKATHEDGFAGDYPPTDTGSDGPSGGKAARDLGYLSGWVHALSMPDVLNGLQSQSGAVGINWYDEFDSVGADGVLSLSATARVRGGHEVHAVNVDMERERLEVCNSWGPSWGKQGWCYVPFKVMERLLSEDGDATFPVPLTLQPPTPTPVPVTRKFTADQAATLDRWATAPHVWSAATKAAKAWKAAV